jgi:hypothetical protein
MQKVVAAEIDFINIPIIGPGRKKQVGGGSDGEL